MAFLDDLHRWAVAEINRRGLTGENIRRLLLGDEVGTLSPIDRDALPGELLESHPGIAESIEEALISGDWLCWPSSDGAVYGWGDPYENPPGTPVNPPLGTVQTSFDDVSLIAREIDQDDIVTHGVNKIAAPRDWRHDSSPLVVSWNSGAIYSGGAAIITGGNILAACVRWSSGTPYLIWLTRSPDRMTTQQCTISQDVVTGVTGGVAYCNISGGLGSPDWCEFSQNGNALIINAGGAPQSELSFSVVVPATFTSQSVGLTLEGTPGVESKTWVNNTEYEAEVKYLIKSQYIDNVLQHAHINVHIQRKTTQLEFYEENPFPQAITWWNWCGLAVWTRLSTNQGAIYSGHSETTYELTITIEFGSTEVYSITPAKWKTDSWLWYGDVVEADDPDPDNYTPPLDIFPDPTHGPFPGWCTLTPRVASVTTTLNDDLDATFSAGAAIDQRHGKIGLINVGTSDDRGNTWSKRLRTSIVRGGLETDSAQISGDFGYYFWPFFDTITSSALLSNALNISANQFCDIDGIGIVAGSGVVNIASLDLSDERAVQCVWGLNEADSLNDYVNLLEGLSGQTIEGLLSIGSKTNPRIIIKDSNRYMGLIKQYEEPTE